MVEEDGQFVLKQYGCRPPPYNSMWAIISRHKKYLRNIFTKVVFVDPVTRDVPVRYGAWVIEKFQQLYEEQEALKKKKSVNKLGITNHAKFRFIERFNSYDYSIDDLMSDVRKGWKLIRQLPDGKFLIRWQLGKYIMSKDFYIVTMFPYHAQRKV